MPFRATQNFSARLGSTNPQPIYVVEEPLPFRLCGFSPHFDLTPTRILITVRSTHPLGRASSQTVHQFTTQLALVWSVGSVFSPVHFGR